MKRIEESEEIGQVGVIVRGRGTMKVIGIKEKVQSELRLSEQIRQLLNPLLVKESHKTCSKYISTLTTGIIKVLFSTKSKRTSLLYTVMSKLLSSMRIIRQVFSTWLVHMKSSRDMRMR